jgi:hypothetical protein
MNSFEVDRPEEKWPLLPQKLPKLPPTPLGLYKIAKGAVAVLTLLGFAGVATRALNSSSAAQSDLASGSDTTPELVLTVKSGPYSDEPGIGYASINSKRFAEPQRATAFTVAVPSQVLAGCAWSLVHTNPGNGGGPWDDIVGVPAAATFAPSGATNGSSDTFAVIFPSPGAWALTISCRMTNGQTATLENEATSTHLSTQ